MPVINEASIITALFSNGLELLHIRKPFNTITDTEELITNIPKEFHNRIVIHQHYQLTNYFALKGIHKKSNTKENISEYNIISTSCHSFAELSSKNDYQYVFLSPIFNSISKDGYKSQFTFEELKEAKKEGVIDSKVIALGGINPQNIGIVKELGFGGVAILGYIWD